MGFHYWFRISIFLIKLKNNTSSFYVVVVPIKINGNLQNMTLFYNLWIFITFFWQSTYVQYCSIYGMFDMYIMSRHKSLTIFKYWYLWIRLQSWFVNCTSLFVLLSSLHDMREFLVFKTTNMDKRFMLFLCQIVL